MNLNKFASVDAAKTGRDLFDPQVTDVTALNRPCFSITEIKF